jgi:hypothetical protein
MVNGGIQSHQRCMGRPLPAWVNASARARRSGSAARRRVSPARLSRRTRSDDRGVNCIGSAPLETSAVAGNVCLVGDVTPSRRWGTVAAGSSSRGLFADWLAALAWKRSRLFRCLMLHDCADYHHNYSRYYSRAKNSQEDAPGRTRSGRTASTSSSSAWHSRVRPISGGTADRSRQRQALSNRTSRLPRPTLAVTPARRTRGIAANNRDSAVLPDEPRSVTGDRIRPRRRSARGHISTARPGRASRRLGQWVQRRWSPRGAARQRRFRARALRRPLVIV